MGKLRFRPRSKRSQAATALGLVGALIMSVGVVLIGAAPASADTEHCPTDYTKINQPTGEESGEFGELEWGGLELDYVLEEGYTLSICLKISDYTHTVPVSGEGQVDTPPLGPNDQQQAISYIAYKIIEPPGKDAKTPAGIDADDPCGPINGNVAWKALEDDFFTYAESDGVVTATLLDPDTYGVADGATTSWTLADYETNEPCPGKPAKAPAGIDADDPCGPINGNVTWKALEDDFFTYAESDGVVTATLKDSDAYDVADGATTTWTLSEYETNDPCEQPTTTTESEQRKSCASGVEGRSRTVTTRGQSTTFGAWSDWTPVRGLTDTEFEELGCRPDQPEPAEVLGSETRMNCVGLQQRSSSQVTTFVWNASKRDYVAVVGDTNWSDWQTVRKLTTAELKAEGCVLGEETLVPTPKPDKKPTKAVAEPTVKGVERVAPPAAVPTAVAAGASAASPNAMTQLLAQLLVGGGMLLLLAGGWIGFGRREGGAHEA